MTVGLNTDKFIEKYKGKRPIMSFQERFDFIDSLDLVDFVIPNDQANGNIKNTLGDIDMIVIATDWGRKDYLSQIGLTWDYLETHNISLCYTPYTKGISTTEIKKRIHEA